MDRQTAVILEGIFGAICALFAILWLIITVIPVFNLIGWGINLGSMLFSMFFNIYFIWVIIFIIPASIFNKIRKNIDKSPSQMRQTLLQPQQQQQQIINVSVPSPIPSPPAQCYATSSSPLPPSQLRQPPIPPMNVIFCSSCGGRNRKDARFCRICGASID